MDVQTELPLSHPMRAAWERYKRTEGYANTRKWAMYYEHVDGSLWAAFVEGWNLASAAIIPKGTKCEQVLPHRWYYPAGTTCHRYAKSTTPDGKKLCRIHAEAHALASKEQKE